MFSLKSLKRSGWLALRVSESELCFVVVERQGKNKPVVVEWGKEVLSLSDPFALRSFAQQYKLSQYNSIAVLGRGDYRLVQVDGVEVPESELKQAIRWRLKDMLDFPVTQATVELLHIPKDPQNPSRTNYLLAVAARNERIREQIVAFSDSARLNLQAIDIAEMGQRNIASLIEQQDRGLALLSFNREGGLLTLSANGELFHAVQLNVTTEHLQDEDDERRMAVYERIALDLQRTLDNFERQFSYVAVARLVLAPFRMSGGLYDYLSSYLYQKVDPLNLAEVFDLSKIPSLANEQVQSELFSILGVALRERS